MDENKRAELQAERERTLRHLSDLRSELSQAGAVFSALGEGLKSQPENVVFQNAPAEAVTRMKSPGRYPVTRLVVTGESSKSAHEWSSLDVQAVVGKLVDLRGNLDRLHTLERRLQGL